MLHDPWMMDWTPIFKILMRGFVFLGNNKKVVKHRKLQLTSYINEIDKSAILYQVERYTESDPAKTSYMIILIGHDPLTVNC